MAGIAREMVEIGADRAGDSNPDHMRASSDSDA